MYIQINIAEHKINVPFDVSKDGLEKVLRIVLHRTATEEEVSVCLQIHQIYIWPYRYCLKFVFVYTYVTLERRIQFCNEAICPIERRQDLCWHAIFNYCHPKGVNKLDLWYFTKVLHVTKFRRKTSVTPYFMGLSNICFIQ